MLYHRRRNEWYGRSSVAGVKAYDSYPVSICLVLVFLDRLQRLQIERIRPIVVYFGSLFRQISAAADILPALKPLDRLFTYGPDD